MSDFKDAVDQAWSGMSFEEVARKAEEALDIAESGRLRPMPLRHEGPRAYSTSRMPPHHKSEKDVWSEYADIHLNRWPGTWQRHVHPNAAGRGWWRFNLGL